MNGYTRSMQQYAVFRGRAARAEFWQFTGGCIALVVVALLVDGAVVQKVDANLQKEPGGIFTALVVLAHIVPAFAVTVRRLHDTDRTGWLVLLNYLPPLNLIIVGLACLRGTVGPNRYGPDPLDPNATAGSPTTPGTIPIPAPVAPPVSGTARTDVIAELERLGRLRWEGHLNEAEFEVMKAEALTRVRR